MRTPARRSGTRGVRLATTFGGAGVMSGDLTPQCAAVVGAVLDALAAPGRGGGHQDQGAAVSRREAEAMRRLRKCVVTYVTSIRLSRAHLRDPRPTGLSLLFNLSACGLSSWVRRA